MNTQENNKLIAEFMGARPITFNDGKKGHTFWKDEGIEGRYGAFPDGSSNYFDYDKGYHTSWEWLMPVVQKIKNIAVEDENIEVFYEVLNHIPDRHETYKAVVEFINQLNQ